MSMRNPTCCRFSDSMGRICTVAYAAPSLLKCVPVKKYANFMNSPLLKLMCVRAISVGKWAARPLVLSGDLHGADHHFFCQFEPLNGSQLDCGVL